MPHLASWYMPGFSDGLGSRLLMFDNTRAPAWELLRLRTEFAAVPAFEIELRERIEQLAPFRHRAFSTVRFVDQRSSGGGLAVVSSFGPGRRLSETLERPRSAGAALHVIREVTPALAEMHRHGLVHGALTVDRVVLVPRGRVLVRDHALGSALKTLGWSPARLWVELGIITPPEGAGTLDQRSDVIQIGLIALAVMLGRRVEFAEYPSQIGKLLDRVAKTAGQRNPAVFQVLRTWVERALQLQAPSFESAEDAAEAISDWSDEASNDEADFELPAASASTRASLFGEQSGRSLPAAQPQRSTPVSAESTTLTQQPEVDTWQAGESAHAPESAPTVEFTPVLADSPIFEEAPVTPRSPSRESRFTQDVQAPLTHVPARARPTHRVAAHAAWSRPRSSLDLFNLSESVEEQAPDTAALEDSPITRGAEASSVRTLKVTAAASLLVAAVEAVALVYLLVFRAPTVPPPANERTVAERVPASPTGPPSETGRVGPPPALPAVPAESRNVQNSAPRATTEAPPARPQTQEAKKLPAVMRVSSPIDLDVFEGSRHLGSTGDGAIEVPPGRHRLTLINKDLGYSVQRVVEAQEGQSIPLRITPGNGRVNINATPWAEVWVNGSSIGVTPLAAISMPLGDHEFVFRHPQLGERRRVARVRSGVTLVTVSLGS